MDQVYCGSLQKRRKPCPRSARGAISPERADVSRKSGKFATSTIGKEHWSTVLLIEFRQVLQIGDFKNLVADGFLMQP